MNSEFFNYTVPWDITPSINIEEEIKNQISKISLSDAKEISLVLQCTPETFKMEIHKNINLTKMNNNKNVDIHEINSQDPFVIKNEFSKITNKVVNEKKPIKLNFSQILNESINKNNLSKKSIDRNFSNNIIAPTKNQPFKETDNQNVFDINNRKNNSTNVQNTDNEIQSKINSSKALILDNLKFNNVVNEKEIERKDNLINNKNINNTDNIENSRNDLVQNSFSKNSVSDNVSITQEICKPISDKNKLKNVKTDCKIKDIYEKNTTEILKPNKEKKLSENICNVSEMIKKEKNNTSKVSINNRFKDFPNEEQFYEEHKEIFKPSNDEHQLTVAEIDKEKKTTECKENTNPIKPVLEEKEFLKNENIKLSKTNLLNTSQKKSSLIEITQDKINDFPKQIIQKEIRLPTQIIDKKIEEYPNNTSKLKNEETNVLSKLSKIKNVEELPITSTNEVTNDYFVIQKNKEKDIVDTQPKIYQDTKFDNNLKSNNIIVKDSDCITKEEFNNQTKDKIDNAVQKNEETIPANKYIKSTKDKLLNESNRERIKITNEFLDNNDKENSNNNSKKVTNELKTPYIVTEFENNEKDIKPLKKIENNIFDKISKEDPEKQSNNNLNQVVGKVKEPINVNDTKKNENLAKMLIVKNTSASNESLEDTIKKQLNNFPETSIEKREIENEFQEKNTKKKLIKQNIHEEVKTSTDDVVNEKIINKVIPNLSIHKTNLLNDNFNDNKVINEMKNIKNILKPIIDSTDKNLIEAPSMNINTQHTENLKSFIENKNGESKDGKNNYKSYDYQNINKLEGKMSDTVNKEIIQGTKISSIKLEPFLDKTKKKSHEINPLFSDSTNSMTENSKNSSLKKIPTDSSIQSCNDIPSTSSTLRSIDGSEDFKIKKRSQKRKKDNSCEHEKKSTNLNFPFLIGITSIVIVTTIIIIKRCKISN